nr:transcription-repair coupling factor [Treponemataceae bacterium]
VPVAVFGSAVSEGFAVPELKLRVIQENEIFGRKNYVPKSLRRVKSKALDTFVELNPGDFVVHVNYGIGVFRGIERVRAMGNERAYNRRENAGEEFVFVPIEQVNLVQRYIGSEDSAPHLDRIGSKAWENRKSKVRREVEDLAKKLIDLYSRRKASAGFPFPPDTEWQTMFEAAFPYEDTPDQIVVTEEVKRDMEKPVPMDRLICGDVGYGKTEIAMRAAFKAVLGGRQVAFLAPTTILAEQHYESCVERFHSFPVRIAHLSRFVQPSEQKKILSEAADGKIDILIGTHRIIQKDVAFKNLGLMIIDEEQRFGVKDKERLKVLKNNIDSLALSATPIPRTLHMSLLKIRDMSLLATPPQNRQPVETVIEPFSDGRIAAAIRKEVERGGQVFYLHNRVESLGQTRARLERLLPEMLVDVAHGQMTSGELDDIFRRFKMGGFHVLVATTIIENGIDIPNVNTIIIDRADMYGVSQLYQLRGRVGRSDRKAYAYLLYPENRSLSEIAMKRLQVISDFTELGSGFKIAMKDMEIRGAGNLLGRDQSGNFHSVGFDMYMRLLDDAVNRLTAAEGGHIQMETLLELEYSGFIPDSYVQNAQTKMEIYKKIAAVQEQAELDSVYNELLDRFGPVPEEASSLLALAEIRILCRRLKIASIKERNGVAAVEFASVSDISIDKVLNLIASSAGAVKLNQSNPNTLFLMTGKIGLREKSEFIREKLERLA